MGFEGTFFNIAKSIYCKPTVNIICSGEKLEAFPLRSGTKEDCILPPVLLNIVLRVLAIAIQQDIAIKNLQIRKLLKLSLFAYDILRKP